MQQPEFKVIGIAARTTNQLEMAGAGRIGDLWGRFFAGAGAQIPGAVDEAIYSVYSGYESDETGLYDVLVGKKVREDAEAPAGFTSIQIPAARYMTFPAADSTPASVIAAWKAVYAYFSAPDATARRAFTMDFERHAPDRAELFIAVL